MNESRKNHVAALISFLVAVAVFGVARVSGHGMSCDPMASSAIVSRR
jgi:hypothetical protein